MEINLTLVFVKSSQHRLPVLGYHRVSMDIRDIELFNHLRLVSWRLDVPVQWYGDDGIKELTTDDNDSPLKWLLAGELARNISGIVRTRWDKAVLAFLEALPTDTRVVLWFG